MTGDLHCILASDGSLQTDVPQDLTEDRLKEMMRQMLLGRRIDQRAISLQRRGKLGTYAPLSGQEAASVGSAMAMDTSTDYLVPQYREQLAMLHFGLPLGTYLLQRYGHPEGAWLPEHGQLYPQQVALAAHLPHAVGLAWGLQLQHKDAAVLCHFGDGAASEGDFHESLNLAGVRKAPVIFVCQNNQWAISTPLRLQTAGLISDRALGYGISSVRVDGNDVLAMFQVVRTARKRALEGGGPTLVEAVTYRLGAHTTADDPTRYVDPDELEEAKARDPIVRFRTFLQGEGSWDDEQEQTTLEWIDQQIDQATEVFDAAGAADPNAMFAHVYDTEPPRLRRQRQAYEQMVAKR